MNRSRWGVAGRVVAPLSLAGLLVIGFSACSGVGESADHAAASDGDSARGSDRSPAPLYGAACDGALTVGPGIELPDELAEISGIAANSTDPGVVWAVGDGGSPASVYGVSLDGSIVATVSLDGAVNHDWEDLALGPAPDGSGDPWLYVADIGDNTSERERIRVLAFPEPALGQVTVSPLELVANYSTGATDAEAFAVTNDGMWIIGKQWGGGGSPLYRLGSATFGPVGAGDEPTASFEPSGAELDVDGNLVTAMDAVADTGLLAVRTYGKLLLFDQVGPDLAGILDTDPCTAPPIVEGQGESVAVTSDGRSIVTASESGSARPAELHVVTLR